MQRPLNGQRIIYATVDKFNNNNNNNNNKLTFQNAKLTLKSRTGARGGYNQKHANH